ncbi:MAG: hypothetical protein WC975_09290 [Phycisphaerae bacterium]
MMGHSFRGYKYGAAFFMTVSFFLGWGTLSARAANVNLAASGAWNNPNNWNPIQVPTTSDIATISNGLTVQVTNVPNASTGASGIWLGNVAGTSGTLTLNAGLPTDQWFSIGNDALLVGNQPGASGTFNQYGGKMYAAQIVLGLSEASALCNATLDGTDAILGVGDCIMGNDGAGAVLNIKRGVFDFSTLLMSIYPGVSSTINLTGGQMNVGAYAIIGCDCIGEGTNTSTFSFNLGTSGELNNGVIANRSGGQTHDFGVGGLEMGETQAVFQGNGVVGLSGILYNNGRIIADGGIGTTVEKTLDMSSFGAVDSYAENPTGTMGWFARNKAKLVLPTISVWAGSDSYDWGETPGESNIDLINSIYMVFNNVIGGNLPVSLLAPDRIELAGSVENIVGAWNFDGLGFYFGSGVVDLTFRYDDGLATVLSVSESDLRVYQKVGSAWVDVTSGIDTVGKRITANGINSFSRFVVGTNLQVVLPSTGTVSGTIQLLDYTGDRADVMVKIELRQNDTTVRTDRVALNSQGQFALQNVTSGTYDIAFKTYASPQKVLSDVTVNGDTSLDPVSLPNGGCNGDNTITTADLSIVLANMDQIGD